jgi:multidrug efflux pump subunit AcrA (membrane-fusion protein)
MNTCIRKLFLLFLLAHAFIGAEDAIPESDENLSLPYLFVLAPKIRTSFSSVNNSKIEKIHKRMGDSFEKGEVLLQLEDIIQRSLYEKAVGVLEKAKRNYESKKILFEGRVASHDELITLRAELTAAESDVAIAKKNLDDCTYLGLYDGKVVGVNVEVGEYPNHEFYYKDRPMLETISDEVLIAKILVPVNLLSQIHRGQKVFLKVHETNTLLETTINRIGVVIDPISATIPVEAEIENPDRKLLGGMTGTAQLEINAPAERRNP